MKKLFSVLSFVAITGVVVAQSSTDVAPPPVPVNPNAPKFEWVSDNFDFGNLPQGIPATAKFEFTNSGKEALIITDVQRTCGCTNTDWSKEPIAPGQKGWVSATYNAANEGQFNKAITVMSNTDTPSVKLYFKGAVVKEEGGSVPAPQTIFDSTNH